MRTKGNEKKHFFEAVHRQSNYYTRKNLEFAIKVDPKNETIKKKIEEVDVKLKSGFFTVPSVLSEEKNFNVFMRCRENDIQSILNTKNPSECMHLLREWKNTGSRPKM